MKKKSNREIVYSAYKFEDIVRDIFKFLGYKVIVQDEIIDKTEVDLILEKDNLKYVVEVKYFTKSSLELSVILKTEKRLSSLIEKGYIPILVVSNVIRERTLDRLKEIGSQIEIAMDISNLLYVVQNKLELKSRLLEGLGYSTQDIIWKKPDIDIEPVDEKFYISDSEKLIDDLKSIESGKENFQKYEECCIKILKYLFEEELGIWEKQYQSNEELYRFDLVCKIKSGELSEFWETLRNFFNCKYIIFEFKNYKDSITQQQIYTTEKYLYINALRSVAIILSRKGVDNNGLKAGKGTLRENGKLIIVLNDDDIINMIEEKNNANDPANFLANKLDKMLLELEK